MRSSTTPSGDRPRQADAQPGHDAGHGTAEQDEPPDLTLVGVEGPRHLDQRTGRLPADAARVFSAMKTQQNSTTTMTRDVMPIPKPRIRSG